MAMESTLQVRMDTDLKAEVEELYRGMGTSFAEAVRIFARQSVREGKMPFTPSLKTWEEMTQEDIDRRLTESFASSAAGKDISLEQMDQLMKERFARG